MSKENLHGVGGWLAFFIFSTMVLSLVLGSGQLYGQFADVLDKHPRLAYNERFNSMKSAYWYAFWFFYAIKFVSGYRLWKIHTWSSVTFAIKAMWFCIVGAAITNIAIADAYVDSLPSEDIASWLGQVTVSAFFGLLWTVYLLRSVRVRNTYPKLQPTVPN